MFNKKRAAARPQLFLPLVRLSPDWWRRKDCESWLVQQVCVRRYRQQNKDHDGQPDTYTEYFGRPRQMALPRIDRCGWLWKQALECVAQTVASQSTVLIYGDYDCDGVCSTTLMADVLESMGLSVDKIRTFIPNRLTDRYGLTRPALERALCECPQFPSLLICVDCGSPESSAGELQYLREKGVRTIVIDHHYTKVLDENHAADFHLNPKGWQKTVTRADLCDLSAAGLTYFFCSDLGHYGDYDWDGGRAAILAGLGTHADVVPILRLNRDLVRQATGLCNVLDVPDAPLRRIPGLAALHSILNDGFKEKFNRLPRVNEDTFGYEWGPCLNASGRMADPDLSLRLLREKNANIADKLAAECVAMNYRRIYRQRKILEEARQQALAQVGDTPPSRVILVAARHWHKGVSGIIAARLRDEFNRPAIVCADGTLPDDPEFMWTASGRSIDDFDLGKCLALAKENNLIAEGGGHKMAGGLRFTERQRPDLYRWLDGQCKVPNFIRRVDLVSKFEDLTFKQWWQVMKQLRPFGQAHQPTPLILENVWLKNVRFAKFRMSNPKRDINREAKEKAVDLFKDHDEELYDFEDRNPEDAPLGFDCIGIGVFQSKYRRSGAPANTPPFSYTLLWKNMSRVRREWRKHRRYTLELKIIRGNDGAYRLVVLDCWPEGNGLEYPPFWTPPAVTESPLVQSDLIPREYPFGWRLSGG